jgi:flagellin
MEKGTFVMSSLLTNTSAMVALQTLRSINASLDQTNNRVSTGLRVNSAADNAAYWSIATTISSDNGALGAVQDSLGLAKASVDTANTGLDTVRESLQKIKELLVTASAPEADRTKVQTEIDSLLAAMQSTAEASVTSGSNWLSVDAAGEIKTVVSSFSRTGGTVSLDTIDVALDGIALYTATGDAGLPTRPSPSTGLLPRPHSPPASRSPTNRSPSPSRRAPPIP